MDPAVAKSAPVVPIMLGGKERHLKYDLNAVAILENVTGYNMLEAMKAKVFNATYLRALLWAGLLHEDAKVKFDVVGKISEPPELSLIDVGAMIDIANTADALAKAVQAWALSRPEAEEEVSDPTPPSTVLQ